MEVENLNGIEGPLITVISVNFNSQLDEVTKTIQSVIYQSYPKIEFIVVDGKSTNGSLELIQSYKAHIHNLLSEPDNGIYQAMNKGIALANGEWIIFMNMGDAFPEDSELLSRLVYQGHLNEPGIVYGNTLYERGTIRYIHYPFARVSKNKTRGLLSLNHQSLLAHKSLFNQVGGFNEDCYKIMADCHWLNRVLQQKGETYFRYCPELMAVYNEEGLSSNPENFKAMHKENQAMLREFELGIWLGINEIAFVINLLRVGIYKWLREHPGLYQFYRKWKYGNSKKVANLS